MPVDPIMRDRCVIDGSSRLAPLHTIKQFPIWMGCTNSPLEDDVRHDMCWAICEDCGTIQLTELIPLDILYAQSHNSGAIGSIWKKHHQAFADFVLKHNPQTVLEIGGGHGILSMNCHAVRPEIDWTILEPNPTPQQGCKAKFISGFFDDKLHLDLVPDSIVHSHVLEHLYDPLSLLKSLGRSLNENGRHIFSMPNIPVMVDRYFTNAINFEHTYLVSDSVLDAALECCGFRIVEKQFFLADHSVFYSTKKDVAHKYSSIPNSADENFSRYQLFRNHYESLISELNEIIHSESGEIYLFGAHIFAQFLLNMGLCEDRLRSILDNDITKQGKRLVGSNLLVESPQVLRGKKNAIVILRAGVYSDEIRSDIIGNINADVKFI